MSFWGQKLTCEQLFYFFPTFSLPFWKLVCFRYIYFSTISQNQGWMLATWKRHCVNFQVGVPMEMQLSMYGIAHFSKFLWASIIFRRTSRFLALFSSYSFFKHFRISRSISLQWPKNLRTLCSLWHFLSRLIMRLHSSVCRWGDRSGCIFRSEDFSSKTIWGNFHLDKILLVLTILPIS